MMAKCFGVLPPLKTKLLSLSQDLGAIYCTSGSMAWTAGARSSWLISEDRNDDNLRYFSAVKCNYTGVSKRVLKFAFRINEEGQIVIQENVEVPDAEESLAPETPEERKERPKERIRKFIDELFKDREEVEAAEGIKLAEQIGIKDTTLARVRKQIGVESFKKGDIWVWRYIIGRA